MRSSLNVPSKTGTLDDSLSLEKRKSHTKEDQVNRERVPVQRCCYRPETIGSSGCKLVDLSSGRVARTHCG